MKKYFLYELKKSLLPTLVLSVFASAIYLAAVLSTRTFVYDYLGVPNASDVPNASMDSLIAIPIILLMCLCTLVPVFMFSFKMSGRQADCMYAAPIKREKIYLVKSVVGLFQVIVPYTIAFWLGFAATLLKPNMFQLWAFAPAYFASLPLAVLLFGINAFVFTRANRPEDGIIFIALYACAAAMLAGFVLNFFGRGYWFTGDIDISYWFTYSPLTWLITKFNGVISGSAVRPYKFEWLLWLFAALSGVGAWAGLFLTAKKEKAENAGRVSESWFGYRVLIPFYLVFALSFLDLNGSSTGIVIIIFIISAFVGYIIFRRGIKFNKDWIVLAAAVLLGLILALVIGNLPWNGYTYIC